MSGLEDVYACVYCGTLKCSFSGEGNDIACCGEVGHVERVTEEEETDEQE